MFNKFMARPAQRNLVRTQAGATRRARALLTTFVALVTTLSFANTAQASVVGQCVGPLWGYGQQDVCVHADMGGKNYGNRTQWVGWVEVAQPTGYQGTIEIWGDGFYQRAWGVNRRWAINRWVRSGTNICAAAKGASASDVREIACIGIRV